MWKYVIFNGKIYGVLFEIIVECFFVNKDIFERYSLKVFQMFDELLNVLKILKSKGIILIVFNVLLEGIYIYQNIIVLIGIKYDVENLFKSGEFVLFYIKVFDYLKVFYKVGVFLVNYYLFISK